MTVNLFIYSKWNKKPEHENYLQINDLPEQIFTPLEVIVYTCSLKTDNKSCRAFKAMTWILSLWLYFVSKNQVGGESQNEEENPQYNEVHVKLGIFYI